MSTPFIKANGNGQVQQVGSIQAHQQPAPMQIVVNQPMGSAERADNGVLYWLACLFCNCCGLSAMALVLHCAASGLWEQGGHNQSGASGVWRKARQMRMAGCICSIIGLIIGIIILVKWWLVADVIWVLATDPESFNDN
eukprot:CAMPEP_0201593612 /NCGR_PEP_ID=MMETSP0190_2-20130828/191169_1 /ASSEMBLY_ACC=CAM_ASM_000263 /TAXON_ID=37353 /ORGANISM="Rosalina sp." /LENGTH=138 /DNA_ID=CAMNT_0048052877 /DNA_START=126 /DNA_END=542 /DNA_ORIENTATION=+